MTQPFIGQIQPYGFNFPPKNWAQCDGQILNIAQNAALFSLLGANYGGNGQTTFGLPDLRGRAPIHFGNLSGQSYSLGEKGGAEMVALNQTQLPAHSHSFQGSSENGAVADPVAGVLLAKETTANKFYGPMTTAQPLNPASVTATGGNQPHNNIQPYLAVNWCIALAGIFPSRG